MFSLRQSQEEALSVREDAAEAYVDDPDEAGQQIRTGQSQWGMSCWSQLSGELGYEFTLAGEKSHGPANLVTGTGHGATNSRIRAGNARLMRCTQLGTASLTAAPSLAP